MSDQNPFVIDVELGEPLLPAVVEQPLTYQEIVIDISNLASAIILNDFFSTLNMFFNAQRLSGLPPEEESSAASAIIFSMQALLTVAPSAFFYMMFNVFFDPKYRDKQKTIITNNLLLAIFISIPIAIFSYFISDIFAYFAKTPKEVCDIVQEYYGVFCFDFIFHFSAVALHQFAIAYPALKKEGEEEEAFKQREEQHKKKRQRLLSVGGVLYFISVSGFSWLFTEIFPLAFASKLQTIASSFIFGDIVRLFYYGIYFFREGGFFEWPQEITRDTHWPMLKDITRGGWKLNLQLFGELGALSALPLLFNKTVDLDILNAMTQWFLFVIIVPLALAQTAQQQLTNRCDEKKYDQVQRYGNIILAMGFVYQLIFLVIALIIPVLLVGLFMNPDENNNTGMSGDFRAMCAIKFTGLFFTALRNITGMATRPLKMIKVPMINSLLSSCFSVFAAWMLVSFSNLGVAGALIGYYLGEMMSGLNSLRIWIDVSQPERVAEIHANKAAGLPIKEDHFSYWHFPGAFYQYLQVGYHPVPGEGVVPANVVI